MRQICQKIKRAVRIRAIKRWGSLEAKRMLWDDEFGSGQWNYLERTTDDPIYPILEKYVCNGALLDMGCGSGNTANELDYAKFSEYTGTDLSDVAVRKAIERTKANGREAKTEFKCAPIENFSPTKQYDVILFRESIFYIPVRKIGAVLDRYELRLKSSGVFIVRMCDREKYAAIVELICQKHHVLEQKMVEGAKDIIIVFEPANRTTLAGANHA
jgi:2-polyprenyl-6-hydroxyphenyl methylase/3-demethylubiquinone-9 3-methyltransferase